MSPTRAGCGAESVATSLNAVVEPPQVDESAVWFAAVASTSAFLVETSKVPCGVADDPRYSTSIQTSALVGRLALVQIPYTVTVTFAAVVTLFTTRGVEDQGAWKTALAVPTSLTATLVPLSNRPPVRTIVVSVVWLTLE